MFGPLGMTELVIIFVIALIVFGPRKLPELGKSLGKSLSEFKRASNELRSSLEDEIRLEDDRERSPKTTPAPLVAPTPVDSHLESTPDEGDGTYGQRGPGDTTPRGASV